MTELITTDAKPLAKTASAECSRALWDRLTDSQPFFHALDSLTEAARERPDLRDELLATAPRILRHAEPCGAKAVIATLTPLVVLYGVPDRQEAEWRMFWRFYTDALGDLPLESLKAGVDEYVRLGDSEFFPKPGPLKAICEKHAMPLAKAKSRLVRVLERLESRPPDNGAAA